MDLLIDVKICLHCAGAADRGSSEKTCRGFTNMGEEVGEERWQFCHTAAAARGCLCNKTDSDFYSEVKDVKWDDCRNPIKKRS